MKTKIDELLKRSAQAAKLSHTWTHEDHEWVEDIISNLVVYKKAWETLENFIETQTKIMRNVLPFQERTCLFLLDKMNKIRKQCTKEGK